MYRRIQLLNWSFNDFSLQTENYTIAIAVPLSLHDDIDIGEPLALRAHWSSLAEETAKNLLLIDSVIYHILWLVDPAIVRRAVMLNCQLHAGSCQL